MIVPLDKDRDDSMEFDDDHVEPNKATNQQNPLTVNLTNLLDNNSSEDQKY